jgi:hypothetical protein
MLLRHAVSFFCAAGLLLANAAPALAWGERGHDLIARVAARLIVERSPRGDEYAAVFERKELMLGHLANIPDIMWRSLDRATQAENGPTHYVDTDFFDTSPSYATAPRSPAELVARVAKLCAKPPANYVCPALNPGETPQAAAVGTAPFRVRQLFDRMVAALTKAKTAATPKDMIAAVDEALLDGGLMAHFVGDLGNPWHTNRDYDGWESGEGGIHGYFEETLVDALPLALDEDVIAEALRTKPLTRVLTQIPEKERAERAKDPLEVAWALTFDSRARLADIMALDRKVAVTKPSSTEKGLRLKAERRDPRDVRGEFRALITERLATAADTLAGLWVLAYEKAGKPSLKGYKSYAYPLAPEFIKVDY